MQPLSKIPLSAVCEINPSAPEVASRSASVSFVPMSAVDEKSGLLDTSQIVSASKVAKGYTGFRDNDVLFAKITPCMENGKAAIARNLAGGIGFGSTEFHVLRAGPLLLPDYLFLYVRQEDFRRRAKLNFVGSGGHMRVPESFLQQCAIPLPPLSEQRRIVEILRDAEVVRRHQAQAARTAAELVPALFQQMFGEVIHSRRRNPVAKLGTLLKISPQNGHYQPAETYGSGTPIVRIGDFYDGVVNTDGLQRLRVSPDDLGTYGLNAGDILVNRVNSMDYIGKSALLPTLKEPTIFESNMMRLVVDQDRILPRFLIQFLQTNEARSQLRRRAKHAVSQASINQDDVQALDVLVPPISEQVRFVEACVHIESAALTRDELSKELHAALLAHAFNGSLTENWRERNASALATEAADRDAALAAKGIKPVTVGPTARAEDEDQASIYATPTDGAWTDLTDRQRVLWRYIPTNGAFGVSDLLHARDKEVLLAHLSEDSFRRELEVFVARGALVHVSRPQIASEDERDVFRHYYRKVSVPVNEATWNAPSVKAIAESLRAQHSS